MEKEKNNNLEEEYQKSLSDYFEADDAVKKMEQYKVIRKYFELVKKRKELDKKETELYKKRLRIRYDNCNQVRQMLYMIMKEEHIAIMDA